MRSIPLPRIRITDPFWSSWQKLLVDVTLPAQYEQIVETGRLRNFINAAKGAGKGTHEGRYYNDSDVYKWVEACAYALLAYPDAKLQGMMDEVIEAIASAQEPDGYINTFFQLEYPDLKLKNISMMHELYCMGHLIEAGVAHHECTGSPELLGVAIKAADKIVSEFGPDKRRTYCGHQELEVALFRLARAVKKTDYGDLAKFFVDERGKSPSPFIAEQQDPEILKLAPWGPAHLMKGDAYSGEYLQDHAPIRTHDKVVGHAVRAMYFYAAATEMAEGDPDLESALDRIWQNLTGKRMYVTGGIGPQARNEGFTTDYDLPNLTAYAETCASVGLIFWAQRMLEHSGNGEYADVLERALYNGAISGISVGGDRFFYTNPLESRGDHERVPFFDCACCPPNIARLIGSLGSYAASVSGDTLWVHLPVGLTAQLQVEGVNVRVEIESRYPADEELTIKLLPDEPVEFSLRLRIPDWCPDCTIELVPESDEAADFEDGYAFFTRTWSAGDSLRISYAMPPRWVEAHPRVLDNVGRVALMRGPVVYCLEEHESGVTPPQAVSVDTENELVQTALPKGLNSTLPGIGVEGLGTLNDFPDSLYADEGATEEASVGTTFIPYYLWNNRGPSHMQVWVRR